MTKSKKITHSNFKSRIEVYSSPNGAGIAKRDRALDRHLKAKYVDPYVSPGPEKREFTAELIGHVRRAVPDLSMSNWLCLFLTHGGCNAVSSQKLAESVFYTIEDYGADISLELKEWEFDELTDLNLAAVFLIVRKFCLDGTFTVARLRKVIGGLMGRAPDFVFKDDLKRPRFVELYH